MDIYALKTHPIAALTVPLEFMAARNFSNELCLKGTGISVNQLSDSRTRFDLQHELRFYQNLLELTGDITLGLELGAVHLMKHYGIFGYAALCAPTAKDAFGVALRFGPLHTSRQKLGIVVNEKTAAITYSPTFAMDQVVFDLFCDRDISMLWAGYNEAFGYKVDLINVGLMHDGHGRNEVYQRFFGCPIEFNSAMNFATIDASLLATPLASRDIQTFEYLSQQCEAMLTKLHSNKLFTDQVRKILLQRAGFFPALTEIAEMLNLSERSLRRYLTEEGSNYKEILDGIRYALAREYLSETELPLKEITFLLGFSEPGNFTHSFKRWSGRSPSEFRGQLGQ